MGLRLFRCLHLIAFACALVGCSSGPVTYPVHGKVVWKDGSAATELAGYGVTFESEDGKMSSSGEVGADGTFTINTFAAADGALEGKHRVALTPPEFESDTVPPPLLIPPRYLAVASSGLTVEIKPGPNDVVLEVERSKR